MDATLAMISRLRSELQRVGGECVMFCNSSCVEEPVPGFGRYRGKPSLSSFMPLSEVNRGVGFGRPLVEQKLTLTRHFNFQVYS